MPHKKRHNWVLKFSFVLTPYNAIVERHLTRLCLCAFLSLFFGIHRFFFVVHLCTAELSFVLLVRTSNEQKYCDGLRKKSVKKNEFINTQNIEFLSLRFVFFSQNIVDTCKAVRKRDSFDQRFFQKKNSFEP